MLQRIQSVFLLLTTILAGLFLKGNILKFSGGNDSTFLLNIRGIYEVTSDNIFLLYSTFPLLLLSVLLPAGSLMAIFLFRRRKIQMKLTLILISTDLLLILTSAIYIFNFIKQNDVIVIPGLRMFIPVVNFFLLILAYRGIKKDENLVRSYDRLR